MDTLVRQSIPQIIDQLIQCREFENSLHGFFVDINSLLQSGDFVDDFSTIAMEAPELLESFIHKSFVHVGESTTQKNIVSALAKVLEMD